ncbi:MAG: hypothetical protein IPK78_19395 [Rhodospirillales bacterium]|nr:hypothetical protein [Rhodospirillales bacterium]
MMTGASETALRFAARTVRQARDAPGLGNEPNGMMRSRVGSSKRRRGRVRTTLVSDGSSRDPGPSNLTSNRCFLRFLDGALKPERITPEEVLAALRASGLPVASTVAAVVLTEVSTLATVDRRRRTGSPPG